MTWIAMLLMTAGSAFLLIAAIGVIRLPDPLQRMHSATKAGTLGTTLMLVGVMLSGVAEVGATVLLTMTFLMLTLPIGAQLLGRASYVSGAKLEGLEEDPLSHELGRVAGPSCGSTIADPTPHILAGDSTAGKDDGRQAKGDGRANQG